MKNTKTFLKITALGFVSVLTVACLGDDVTRASLDKQSQVQVSHVSFDHLIAADVATGGIGDVEMKRLDSFLRGLSTRFGDKIEIAGGSDIARADLAKHLKPLMLPVFETVSKTEALQIIVHRTVVSVSKCGDWSYQENPMSDNDANRNFGCANETNLARMIANPNDLIEGQIPGAASAGPQMISILKYRAGKLKIDDGAASISDLAGG